MDKPTIEQTAWMIDKIAQCIQEGGSFRYLIYDLMGYGTEAYQPLYLAGGMYLTNSEHKETI